MLVKIWALSMGVEGKAKFVGRGGGVSGNALLRRGKSRIPRELRPPRHPRQREGRCWGGRKDGMGQWTNPGISTKGNI